jgi:hypothetical protein
MAPGFVVRTNSGNSPERHIGNTLKPRALACGLGRDSALLVQAAGLGDRGVWESPTSHFTGALDQMCRLDHLDDPGV